MSKKFVDEMAKKKRGSKRPFYGNRYVNADKTPKLSDSSSQLESTRSSADSSEQRTQESASSRQQPTQSSQSSQSSQEPLTQEYVSYTEKGQWDEPQGNLIFAAAELISSLVGLLHCPTASCNQELQLQEATYHRGWTVQYRWFCPKCKFEKKFSNSSYRDYQSQLNLQLAMAIRATGQNHFQFANFCTIMDMHQPPERLIDLERKILRPVQQIAEQSMKKWTKREVERSGSKDLLVSVDGTWQKRGFCSKNGISIIASPESGKILDCMAKTNYCQKCKGGRRETVTCDCNHQGSAGSMESKGD